MEQVTRKYSQNVSCHRNFHGRFVSMTVIVITNVQKKFRSRCVFMRNIRSTRESLFLRGKAEHNVLISLMYMEDVLRDNFFFSLYMLKYLSMDCLILDQNQQRRHWWYQVSRRWSSPWYLQQTKPAWYQGRTLRLSLPAPFFVYYFEGIRLSS